MEPSAERPGADITDCAERENLSGFLRDAEARGQCTDQRHSPRPHRFDCWYCCCEHDGKRDGQSNKEGISRDDAGFRREPGEHGSEDESDAGAGSTQSGSQPYMGLGRRVNRPAHGGACYQAGKHALKQAPQNER